MPTQKKFELDLSNEFEATLAEMAQRHRDKGHDYGDEDEYKNLNAAKDFGIEPWVGCALRANDKMQRIKSLLKKGELKVVDDPMEDNLLDMAVYMAIAYILYRRTKA